MIFFLKLILGLALAGQALVYAQPQPEFLKWYDLNEQAYSLFEKYRYRFNDPGYDRAVAIAEEALNLAIKIGGPYHPNVAFSLYRLAELYENYPGVSFVKRDQIEVLLKRALDITERVHGSDHLIVVDSLDKLAEYYSQQKLDAQAEKYLKRALQITEKSDAPAHIWHLGERLHNLARHYEKQGQFALAESLYKRAVEIDGGLPDNNKRTSRRTTALTNLYQKQGRFEKAEELEKSTQDSPEGIKNLANLYYSQKKYALAEPLYKKALEYWENWEHSNNWKEIGLGQPGHAISALEDLVKLYSSQGRYSDAISLYTRVLESWEKSIAPESWLVAKKIDYLGSLYRSEGNYTQAESLFLHALEIRKKLGGIEIDLSFKNLAMNSWMSGDIMKAITLEQDANNVRENYLKSGLSNGSEHHKREYINSFDQDIQIAISLHLAAGPSNLPAARLALMTLLQRKGRILDILTQDVTYMRQTLDRGRRHPNSSSKELLDQLQKANVLLNQLLEVNRRRASLFVKAHRAKLAAEQFETHEAARILAGEAQDLEVKIAQILSVAYRPFQQPITLERMQQSIPAGSALVEFSVYKPFDYKAKPPQKTWGEARYIAYILSAHGPPVSVDLGPTDLIDRMVNDFREGLSKPENVYVPRIARKLDEQIMRPVRKLLGETQHIFLSPDGALNLVPFGAFVDENDQYLIKRYAFTYLSSGRDLLRIPTKSESRQPGTIIADVDFGSTEKITQRRQTEKISPNQRSTQLVAEEFQPLPGTAEEAREISKLFPEANVLTGKQATESALKQLNGPQILHLATHGFFFPALSEDPMEDQGFQLQNDSLVPQGPKTENPLWRSGLALANANQLKSGAEDGMLTALEAAGLNLWGTKLVVLSACETGVGEIHNGEGIFGLRRALVIAGSESQVMSLWIVKDQATKVLMIDYYKHLISKMGRSEALRQAQLEMLNSEEYKHPYYWASFVPSGDWKPLKIDLSAEPIVVTEH